MAADRKRRRVRRSWRPNPVTKWPYPDDPSRRHGDALPGGQAPADDPDLGMVHANMNEYLEAERRRARRPMTLPKEPYNQHLDYPERFKEGPI